MSTPHYQHTQVFSMIWLTAPAAALIGIAAIVWTKEPEAQIGACILGITISLVLLVFGRLRVEVDAQTLHWRFGYLGWPSWRVSLADIASVEKCLVTGVGGSGIKRGGGHWVYSAGGAHGIRVTMKDGKQFRIGSNDHERLAAFLATRIGAAR